ncbi:arsenical pump-driving ATPase [Chrysiogenes arsenatis]|uniref:arsenical pump-driving ATPase n=1 Tax=Chrysiogenes arsenatis TaxID=309797 RepID=UPI0003F8A48C|nr:arsenical pump-driving ATPase [Chrysiogenes arsenatis]
MEWLYNAPRNLFFTGKGGVGKTTTATATAIALAGNGADVLLVSTDPASNLDEVLGVHLTNAPCAIAAVPHLFAMNIDPEAAAAAYRERIVGPYRGILPEAALVSIEEQLSGACTVEIAAFDEFTKLIGNRELSGRFAHIVFDTAPTGHTLRLLELPAAWSDFLANNAGGTSCLGPLSGLGAQKELYQGTRAALADPAQTLVVVVARPEVATLDEAARAAAELAALDITHQMLVINGIFRCQHGSDAVARALSQRAAAALASVPAALRDLPRVELPLSSRPLLGIDALRGFFTTTDEEPDELAMPLFAYNTAPFGTFDCLIGELAQAGSGVIMTMGKGGVGKTTLAARIALALASAGHSVHLTTTDPAAHIAAAAGDVLPSNLHVSRIDPKVEKAAYIAEVMATTGATLDEAGRALLEEEMRSPCAEEIAVFRAFARTVAHGTDAFVVIDTAPTGHTLLLLDAAEAYHRQVSRSMGDIPPEIKALLPRLRDPEFTKIVVVTLPEATPVHEASALQDDLKRAGIAPWGWVVNQSFTPLPITNTVLHRRKEQEGRYLDEVLALTEKPFLIAWG